ncbi:MAG: hypothetical protein JJU36_09975, partial [Phycisphaeraceae bacterium]|nr:hypothetical protein [Phycisphaeraceae bacterium]
SRERWTHTSIICALIANAHRDPKKHRPFKPADFNPCIDRRERSHRTNREAGSAIEVNPQTVSIMRAAFTGRSPEPRPATSTSPRKGL